MYLWWQLKSYHYQVGVTPHKTTIIDSWGTPRCPPVPHSSNRSKIMYRIATIVDIFRAQVEVVRTVGFAWFYQRLRFVVALLDGICNELCMSEKRRRRRHAGGKCKNRQPRTGAHVRRNSCEGRVVVGPRADTVDDPPCLRRERDVSGALQPPSDQNSARYSWNVMATRWL